MGLRKVVSHMKFQNVIITLLASSHPAKESCQHQSASTNVKQVSGIAKKSLEK